MGREKNEVYISIVILVNNNLLRSFERYIGTRISVNIKFYFLNYDGSLTSQFTYQFYH